jgi:hypothetical protein
MPDMVKSMMEHPRLHFRTPQVSALAPLPSDLPDIQPGHLADTELNRMLNWNRLGIVGVLLALLLAMPISVSGRAL